MLKHTKPATQLAKLAASALRPKLDGLIRKGANELAAGIGIN